MSEQAQQPATSHFDAAKLIVETLNGLDKTSQALAMRFASETLGLQAASMTPAAVTAASTPVSQSSRPGETHSTDVKQFTAAKAPKSDQQFAAVVAYFYRFEAPEADRKDTINAEVLQEATRLVGRNRLTKPYFTLNNAKNAGYLDTAGKGDFRINSVGENLVAMALPGNGSEGAPKQNVKKKKAPKKKKQPTKSSKSAG